MIEMGFLGFKFYYLTFRLFSFYPTPQSLSLSLSLILLMHVCVLVSLSLSPLSLICVFSSKSDGIYFRFFAFSIFFHLKSLTQMIFRHSGSKEKKRKERKCYRRWMQRMKKSEENRVENARDKVRLIMVHLKKRHHSYKNVLRCFFFPFWDLRPWAFFGLQGLK